MQLIYYAPKVWLLWFWFLPSFFLALSLNYALVFCHKAGTGTLEEPQEGMKKFEEVVRRVRE